MALLWLTVPLIVRVIERRKTTKGPEIKTTRSIRPQTLEADGLILTAFIIHVVVFSIVSIANTGHEADHFAIFVEKKEIKAASPSATYRSALETEAKFLLRPSRRFRSCEQSNICRPHVTHHCYVMPVQITAAPPLIDIAAAIAAVEEIEAPHIELTAAALTQ